MTSSTTPSRRSRSRAVDRRQPLAGRRARPQPASAKRTQRRLGCRRSRSLGAYLDWRGRRRELVAHPGADDSVLVLDRDATTHGDRRLVAHLAADEPATNAELVAGCFREQARRGRCGCRRLTDDDLRTAPFAQPLDEGATEDRAEETGEVGPWPLDREGRRYALVALDTGMSIPELRWCREGDRAERPQRQPLSVRDVVAALESYEPVRSLSARAIRVHHGDQAVSVAVLRAELARVNDSPIVLNRALREAVREVIDQEGLSMSEIAMRCGRVKRDAAGNESGETSWLARRLGLLAEGGRDTPTRWIHTDVLALIARDGLGISPREVELI
jgi:hypothetical protein